MRGLGYFDTQEDAAVAYDTEARKVGHANTSVQLESPTAFWV